MRTGLFNSKNCELKSPSVSDITPLLSPFNENESSDNELNLGFIAEDSKFLVSDSQSVISDGFSISAISIIRGNSNSANMNSPHYARLE